jgi:hypothetical protein
MDVRVTSERADANARSVEQVHKTAESSCTDAASQAGGGDAG